MTPQPRLRTGFFSVLESHTITPSTINEACTSVGVAKYGRPIRLDENIKVDLIVIGSVAVDPKTGARVGKGEVIMCTIMIAAYNFGGSAKFLSYDVQNGCRLFGCFPLAYQTELVR